MPTTPRPSTMLPAQNRLLRTRRAQAEFHMVDPDEEAASSLPQ
jgi:hypothetical protein